MSRDPATVEIFHITPIANLASILAEGGLHSDAALEAVDHEIIGHSHIKQRRLTKYRVDCCGDRFVGEFVPFYFCPRSVMLYTINAGRTGKREGFQDEIVHLVSTVGIAVGIASEWAISDGNAGAEATSFSNDLAYLDSLDWDAINARYWGDRSHQKAAEFLVSNFFPWSAITGIGCMSLAAQQRVLDVIGSEGPTVNLKPNWYFL